jgi:hypothetical protein
MWVSLTWNFGSNLVPYLNNKCLSPRLDSSERGTGINVNLTLGTIQVIVFRYYSQLTGGSSGYVPSWFSCFLIWYHGYQDCLELETSRKKNPNAVSYTLNRFFSNQVVGGFGFPAVDAGGNEWKHGRGSKLYMPSEIRYHRDKVLL